MYDANLHSKGRPQELKGAAVGKGHAKESSKQHSKSVHVSANKMHQAQPQGRAKSKSIKVSKSTIAFDYDTNFNEDDFNNFFGAGQESKQEPKGAKIAVEDMDKLEVKDKDG